MPAAPIGKIPDWQKKLLLSVRLPFWFACFWVAIGMVWRPPLVSVGLIFVFLVLLVAVEWVSRRLTAQKPPQSLPSETETVQQRITRTKTAKGVDRFDGTFWAEFPADVRTTTVHIPFCPAFSGVPKIQAFPLDQIDVNLRVVSPKRFGVRVDVKRSSLETDRFRFAVIAEE